MGCIFIVYLLLRLHLPLYGRCIEDASETKDSKILFYKNRKFKIQKLSNFTVGTVGAWFRDVTVGDVSGRGECNPDGIKLETVVEHV